MFDILAHAPLETDGSIKLKLPAQVPFTLELVDANGRRGAAPSKLVEGR